MKELLVLKAVLLLKRLGSEYQTKEELLEELNESYHEEQIPVLLDWIEELKAELDKTDEERERESEEFLERLMCSEMNDRDFLYGEDRFYSPSSPWNAPGMSIRDFI